MILMKVIKKLLYQIIDNIDAGNSNLSEEEAIKKELDAYIKKNK